MLLNAAVVANLALAFLAFTAEAIVPAADWPELAEQLNLHARSARASAQAERAFATVSANAAKASADFYNTLNRDGAEYLVATASGAASFDAFLQGEGTAANMKRFVENLKGKTLEALSPEACEVLIHSLEHFKQPAHVTTECRTQYLTDLLNGNARLSSIAGIPVKWVEESGPQVVKAVTAYSVPDIENKNGYTKLSTSTFEAIVKGTKEEDDLCRMIPALATNSFPAEMRGKISPNCMSKLFKLSSSDLKLDGYKADVFSLYNGKLTKATMENMTADLIKNFGSKVESDERCKKLKLADLTSAAMRGMTGECLFGYLDAAKKTAAPIGKYLANVPLDAFYQWKEDKLAVVGKIRQSDLFHLPYEVIKMIVESETAISSLPNKTSNVHFLKKSAVSNLAVSPQNFALLAEHSPAFAGQILTYAPLTDDILSYCERSHLENIVGPVGTEAKQGFELLSAISKRPKFANAAKNIGKHANIHFCATFDNAEDYLALDWYRFAADEECKKNIGFTITPDMLKDAVEFADTEEAFRQALEDGDNQFWREISPSVFRIFASRPDFCKAIASDEHKDKIALLSSKSLAVVGPTCGLAWAGLIDETLAPKLGENAFALYKASDMKLPLKALTVAQVSNVSAELPKELAKEHFFAKVDAAKLTELDNARFAAISSAQWEVVPTDVFKAVVTLEKLSIIPAENLTRITDEKLNKLDAPILLAFNVAQLNLVGKDVDAELAAFEKIIGQFDQERIDAIKARQAALAAAKAAKLDTKDEAEESSNAIWWIVGCAVFVIIIAGAVFIIVRRN